MRRSLLLLLAILLPLVALAAPKIPAGRRASAPGPRAERVRFLMGTPCAIQAEALDTTRAGAAIQEAFEGIDRLEHVLSSWDPESELHGLNARASSDRIPCSADLYAVLEEALRVAGETEGAFDPTIEPLNVAWDVRGKGRKPERTEIADARLNVGWRMVVLDPGRHTARFLKPGMGVVLDGVGRGYALDRAADQLRERRVTRALLNFGGDVLALTSHQPWQVAVADPADPARPVIRIALSNGAVSTSGQLERGAEMEGAHRALIIDPRIGAPLVSRATVSVVTRSAARASALSTALLVMGRERAFEFAGRHPEIGVLWLEPDGDQVRAWVSNLPAVTDEPNVRIHWVREP